jgi:hypothetical protein
MRFVEHNAAGHGKIETADVCVVDWNSVAMLGEVFQDERWQPLGFFPENQEITGGELTFQVGLPGLLAQKMKSSQGMTGEKGFEVIPVNDFHILPVIEASPFKVTVIRAEAKRPDEMQNRLGRTAQSCNASGVGRNFWFNQDNVEWNW